MLMVSIPGFQAEGASSSLTYRSNVDFKCNWCARSAEDA